ncbi:MAG: M20/M25/M40 family metallo-hydrolase [Candidatus Zixiibacteriota bacterium]
MKIAIIYNRGSDKVINLFGIPNKEIIGLQTIKRIADGLKKGGHVVRSFEGGKDLVDHLEDFMPRVLKGERPGMAFNISYGIQGQARYTHVPSILEMVGIPYVGSGPLAHSLALDKVVAKMIFRQHGIPTPDFAVLDAPGFEAPGLRYPLIVKPKNEAVSFGLRIVTSERELREAAGFIFQAYYQPVLVEQYIEGREINVGLLGNNPPEVLPPVELVFSGGGPAIYTYEDKTRTSGRAIDFRCPAPLDGGLTESAQNLARKVFSALGCQDCARVDMRLDTHGNFHVLELNSLPSLGEHGSYTIAAEHAGLDFPKLVCRLVEVASARYFGTPSPPQISTGKGDLGQQVFSYLVERRDRMEKRLQEWVSVSSRTSDPTGIQEMSKRVMALATELKLQPVSELTDERAVWTWQSRSGLKGGTLLISHLDVPLDEGSSAHSFRRDPEWLYGEGIGVSRAPLVMLEFALRALRSARRLQNIPLGALFYADEGRECRYSRELIKKASTQAKQVLVLRPGTPENHLTVQRRGWRKYRLIIEETPRRLGKAYKTRGVLQWTYSKLDEMGKLSSKEDRVAVDVSQFRTEAFPQLLPHRAIATLLVSFLDTRRADSVEQNIRSILSTKGYRWNLELVSDRPSMKKRKVNDRLVRSLKEVAQEWEIPLTTESSLYASVAGLVSGPTSVVCGLGPVTRNVDTPQESVQRISLVQRTLLLTQFLAQQFKSRVS